MYTIDKQQAQYETYILSDEINHSRLEVVPARGGIITRWRIQGQNILYFDAERFSQPNLSVRGGIPILFPICGNLPHNSYTHQGKTYQLKQHGFARDLPWEVIATETQESAQMILQLTSNDYTLSVYPFAFSLRFTYQLQGNKLTILQVYENLSQESMKFSCGFHPYFLTEDKSKLAFDIPATTYQDQITQEINDFSGSFNFDQPEIDVAFKELHGQSTAIYDYHARHKITINYSDIFSTLVFWTVKGKDYVCLEPWSAPRNAMNTGENLIFLPAGKLKIATVSIQVDNLE